MSGKQPSNRYRPVFWLSILGIAAIFGYLLVYHYHHESRDAGKHLGDFPTFYQAAYSSPWNIATIYTAGLVGRCMVWSAIDRILVCAADETAGCAGSPCHARADCDHADRLDSARLEDNHRCRAGTVRSGGYIAAVAFMVTALGENELRAQMTMLETDALMLLMFTLALCWLDRRPIWAGLALAPCILNIKYLSIVTLPYLILRGRWKAAGSMVLGIIFFALLPALLLGWHEEIRCLQVSTGGLLRWVGLSPAETHSIEVHNLADDLSISITSGVARMMSPRGFSNPAIMLVATGIGLLAVVVVAWMYRINGFSIWRRSPSPGRAGKPFSDLTPLEWAGLVTAALVFSPNTNSRHLVLAVLVKHRSRQSWLRRQHVRSTDCPGGSEWIFLILLGFIMISALTPNPDRLFHLQHSLLEPCWVGYLLILWTALRFGATSEESAS